MPKPLSSIFNLTELFKPKELTTFKKSLSGYDKVDSRDSSWNLPLPKLMSKYGFKLLGSGKYASVFGHSKYPYVIKVFMKDSAYLRWVAWSQKHQDNPFVPKFKGKVLKITPTIYAMRMEKLSPGSFSGEFAKEYMKWERDISYVSDNEYIQEILEFFKPNRKLLDLHGENVMMRGNQLVVIDPFYNWFDKHSKSYTIDPDEVDQSVF